MIVIKIGGAFAVNEAALFEFCGALASLATKGHSLVLVHGGGKDINENLSLLKEAPQFSEGLRVTTKDGLRMVEMTLSGHVNKKLVRYLYQHGCASVGLSGLDGGPLLSAEFLQKPVGLGFVGEVTSVKPQIIETLCASGWTPVISPISMSASGEALNVNADHAASAIAIALKATQLVFVSDVEGVLQNGTRIEQLNPRTAEALITQEVVTGGMIPKVRSCLECLEQGVGAVHITGWKGAMAFENQILGIANLGTVFTSELGV
jgi:acetylglutamate kinase